MSSMVWVGAGGIWHLRNKPLTDGGAPLTNTFVWMESEETYWVMLDGTLPSGRMIGGEHKPALKIAGPFKTLDQAKTACLILPRKVIL